MKHYVNFTPGPSQLYFSVWDHTRQAFKEGIPSLSHRTKEFEKISHKATAGLRTLLNIPDSHSIFFTGSATEIWERAIENLVHKKSFHLVNGSFSKRFHEIALQLGRTAQKLGVKEGEGFKSIEVPDDIELIAVTHNETSTGVSTSVETIHAIKDRYPNALLVVDAVSSLPYPAFDYTKVDSVFFSVQKGFGLPAGLGVWIVNDRCIEKANRLQSLTSIGSYHSIPSLKQFADKNQTPETPNVLGIYLLAQVVEDFLRKGADTLRRETEYKAAILYNQLSQHALIKPFVGDAALQSKTVIVASCGDHTERLTKFLQEKGLYPGDGYGSNKKTQLRFANFPAHSKEQFEQLVDAIAAFS